jgi:hypothetical protein
MATKKYKNVKFLNSKKKDASGTYYTDEEGNRAEDQEKAKKAYERASSGKYVGGKERATPVTEEEYNQYKNSLKTGEIGGVSPIVNQSLQNTSLPAIQQQKFKEQFPENRTENIPEAKTETEILQNKIYVENRKGELVEAPEGTTTNEDGTITTPQGSVYSAEGKLIAELGTVTPLTSTDVFDLVTMFTGLGIAKTAAKKGVQLTAKEGAEVATKLFSKEVQTNLLGTAVKTTTKKTGLQAAKTISSKFKSLLTGALATVGLATSAIGALNFLGVEIDKDHYDAFQQSANTLGEQVSDINSAVNNGVLTPDAAEEQINIIEDGLDFYKEKLQLNIRENRKSVRSGEAFDIWTDIYEKEKQILLARGEIEKARLTQQYDLVNEQEITNWVSGMTSIELNKVSEEYANIIDALTRGEVPYIE